MFQYKNTKTKPDFQLKNVKVQNKFTFSINRGNFCYIYSEEGNQSWFPFRKTSINSSSKMCARHQTNTMKIYTLCRMVVLALHLR